MAFGSEERERLQAQVQDLTAALTTERRTNALQQDTLEANRQTIDDQRSQIRRLEAATRVNSAALRALQEAEDSNETVISAEELAIDILTKRYIAEATGVQTDKLLTEREREFRSSINGQRIDAIRAELDETFLKDGTYDKLRKKVELDIRDELSADLVAAKEAEIRAELADPDTHDRMVAEQRAKLEQSGEFDRLRETAQSAAHATWREEAISKAKEAIAADIGVSKDAFVAQFVKTWRESEEGRRTERAAKESAQKKWREATALEVAQELRDTAVLELLSEKNERTQAELARERFYEESLADFFRGGIDVQSIGKGTTVVLRLGEIKNVAETNGYGTKTGKMFKNVDCKREITLTAIGEGRFMVNGDTLQDSDNMYEQDAAIPVGEVIHIGRKKMDRKIVTLDEFIAEQVPLFYDDDTTNDNIIDAKLEVVDIGLDGKFAQQGIKDVTYPKYVKGKGVEK